MVCSTTTFLGSFSSSRLVVNVMHEVQSKKKLCFEDSLSKLFLYLISAV